YLARLFASFFELCALEGNFWKFLRIEELLAFHVSVEHRNEGLDAIGYESYVDRAVLGVCIIVKKLAIVFQEMRALMADAEMVPAEADLGVVLIENIRLRPSQGSLGERKQCEGGKGREANDHYVTPVLVNLPSEKGLAWRR